MRGTRLLAAWAVMALALTACGGAGASTAASPPAAASAAAQSAGAEATSVNIVDFAFEPADTTVAVGTTVSFNNTGAAPHTATADDDSFDTDSIAAGATGSLTFDTAGTFPYHCTFHPQMKATITVEG